MTRAAQIVELRETVREIEIPRYVETLASDAEIPVLKPPIFSDTSAEVLLSFGVPPEWVDEVRGACEDKLLDIADHLPEEAAEALLTAADGGTPSTEVQVPFIGTYDSIDEFQPVTAVHEANVDYTTDPFEHPDARRRFYVVDDSDDLEHALEYPWDKWAVFLHPTQKRIVEANYEGPFRVSGSAGTGKSIVAIHRAVYLASINPKSRVLLTTFSDTLASDLREKLKRLISTTPKLADQVEADSCWTSGRTLWTHGNWKVGNPIET